MRKTSPSVAKAKKTIKPYGFVLHFGYVESSRAAPLILHSNSTGFASLRDAVVDLARFFVNGYLSSVHSAQASYDRYPAFHKNNDRPDDPTVDDFRVWMYDQPITTASSGPSWDEDNTEEWWPWDSMTTLVSCLDLFYENTTGDGADTLLPRFVDVSKIDEKYSHYVTFLEEIKEYQAAPGDLSEFHQDIWARQGAVEESFTPILAKTTRKR